MDLLRLVAPNDDVEFGDGKSPRGYRLGCVRRAVEDFLYLLEKVVDLVSVVAASSHGELGGRGHSAVNP